MKLCRTLLMALPCAGLLMACRQHRCREPRQVDPSAGNEAIAVRVENLAVLPQSQPVLAVHVRNLRDVPFAGVIKPIVPRGLATDTRRAIGAAGTRRHAAVDLFR